MISLIKKPFRWTTAHREILFTFDYQSLIIDSQCFLSDINGKLCIFLIVPFVDTPTAGQYIYVSGGINKGYHLITNYASGIIYTASDVVSISGSGVVKLITSHVFKIKSGYNYPAELAELQPYELRATFKPEPNKDGLLVVNVSGYVNKLFDVINSTETVQVGAVNVYYNMFTNFNLIVDDSVVSNHNVANASISMFEFNELYVETGLSLNSGNLGNHYNGCINDSWQIVSSDYIIVGKEFESGIPVTNDNDFDVTDFDPSDFQTG